MAAQGYVMAGASYRLSQEATFPARTHDNEGALRWLRAHAREYHIDPTRVGAFGGSAGGHLVAFLGTTAGIPEL
jgi:acetyl esterase/lipase